MSIKTKVKSRPRKPFVNEEPAGIKLLKILGIFIFAFILLVILAALFLIPLRATTTYSTPYDDCAAAGNPILKIYPAKCVWPDGRTVTQIVPGLSDVVSFDTCVAAGYPVMESYPEQCRTRDGQLFVNKHEGYCATTISAEGTPDNPDPYMHQRENCMALTNEFDCTNGGTPEWLASNRPFTCEWQSFT